MWRDVIKLITLDSYVNDMGDVIEIDIVLSSDIELRNNIKLDNCVPIFTNKKSIGQKEYYESMKAGLKPELIFEVRSVEYHNELVLSHEDKFYKIIRTYDRGEFIELICSGLVGD